MTRPRLLLAALALAAAAPAHAGAQLLSQSRLTAADADPGFHLTLDHLGMDLRWLGVPPRGVVWASDGEWLYFRWREDPAPDQLADTDPWLAVDRRGRRVRTVPENEVRLIPAGDRVWSLDRGTAAWSNGGSLFLWRAGQGPPREVFRAGTGLRDLHITPDGARVFFATRGGGGASSNESADLWAFDVAAGTARQIAEPRTKSEEKKTDAARWLEAQQLELLGVVAERKREREVSDSLRRARGPEPPQAIPVEKGARITDIRLSPDGRFLTFRWSRGPADEHRTQYMEFVNESGYATPRSARPKVGEPTPAFRMGIVRVDPAVHPDSVTVAWVEDGTEKETILHGPWWSPDGRHAAVQMLSLDHKDRWISLLDVETGKTTVLDHQHEEAWIGGPLIEGRWQPGFLRWLPDGSGLAFASAATGWSHLYLAEPDGDGWAVRQLTAGEFEIRDAELSPDGRTWYLAASREHPGEEHLYHLPARGGELRRVTRGVGMHRAYPSPDGSRLATLFETAHRMPDLYLMDNRPTGDAVAAAFEGAAAGGGEPGSGIARVTKSGTDDYWRLVLPASDVFEFPLPDGTTAWAEVWEKPDGADGTAPFNGAAVVYVHGCGECGQGITMGWRRVGMKLYARYLRDRGYLAANFDYRGSAGYGWRNRTYAYRQMGISDVDSSLPFLDILADRYGVDPARVGVYGGSYGGFFTLMALFRHPDRYAAGVALYPVADWAHYNHGYTSRILNGAPYEDEEAYRRSSPIYYADGLEGALMIQHGLVDGNVQVQDVFRLAQKLLELKKPFDLVVYPVEDHGWDEPSTRRDSYRRMTEWFDRHLLGGGIKAAGEGS